MDRRSRPSRINLSVEPLEGRRLQSGATHALPEIAPRFAHHSNERAAKPANVTPARWSWLTNTYWYVPAPNLPATIYNGSNGTLVPILDQTVYHISGYKNGYFWGETVTQLGSSSPSSSAVLGSVTPQGKVLLNFVGSSTVTEGYGTMVKKHGQWTMENQMFTGTGSTTQIGHWAYMVQTRPGMKSWNSLPLAGVSVPTFMSNYNAPVPTPIGG